MFNSLLKHLLGTNNIIVYILKKKKNIYYTIIKVRIHGRGHGCTLLIGTIYYVLYLFQGVLYMRRKKQSIKNNILWCMYVM